MSTSRQGRDQQVVYCDRSEILGANGVMKLGSDRKNVACSSVHLANIC